MKPLASIFPFLTERRTKTVEVLGVPTVFYPLSTGATAKLLPVLRPVGRAFMALLAPSDRDAGSKQTNTKRGEDFEQVIELTALSTETAKFRLESRQVALEGLITALLGPDTRHALAELLALSLDVDVPKTPAEKEEFLNSLPFEALPDLLKGVAAANEGISGPLKEWVGELKPALKKAVAVTEES